MVNRETAAVRRRYDRIAGVYDVMESGVERRYARWRKRQWAYVEGPRVLDVGVGTGKSMPYYPAAVQITGVDLSRRMLTRARRRASRLRRRVFLAEIDAQALAFPDATFDSAAASFVFCSVPDAVTGLREVARVVRPGGRIVLLEHVRATHRVLGAVMDLLDPLAARLMGPHINRRTVDNVRMAGLVVERVEDLGRWGIFKLILARRA